MKLKKTLLLALAAVSVTILAGCSDTPADAAGKWRDAIVAGSVDEANKYSTKEAQILNSFMVAAIKENKDNEDIEKFKSVKFENGEIKEDTATVYTIGEDGKKEPMEMKKVDGKWLVDAKKN